MAVLAPDPRLEEKALAIAFEEIESRKSLGDRGAKLLENELGGTTANILMEECLE